VVYQPASNKYYLFIHAVENDLGAIFAVNNRDINKHNKITNKNMTQKVYKSTYYIVGEQCIERQDKKISSCHRIWY